MHSVQFAHRTKAESLIASMLEIPDVGGFLLRSIVVSMERPYIQLVGANGLCSIIEGY